MNTTTARSEFDERFDGWRRELRVALRALYPDRVDEVFDRLVEVAADASAARSTELRDRDRRRVQTPDWFQEVGRVGYTAYVDRFGGDLAGVRRRIPHLIELGVDILHLLSLFAARLGDNDGGYAIRDYLLPDPAVGSPSDLDDLIADLHAHDISLCADFVLNHCSDDHEWAVAARAGSSYHRDLFITFDDEAEVAAYEAGLPEVFPKMAPGNFTFDAAIGRWVWTTFNTYQWDLNWANPDVMVEIVGVALGLANLGVDILRLDAIAFTWKRLGTGCQNQPEAHLIAQVLRAVVSSAAPATILLAEAIVGPDDLVGYLGRHDLERRECQIAYHNQLMVQGWSMLATGEAALAEVALSRLNVPPSDTTWFDYVRCHDDIGWAIDDCDAARAGVSGTGHREFLARFYRGDFPMSFAAGTPFGVNDETGDERTCGMTATLTGVARAQDLDDEVAMDLGVRRAMMLYGLAFGYGGIPLIYMGDEIGQLDAAATPIDPTADTRWVHRPDFDDVRAAQRHTTGAVAERFWTGLRHLVETRRGTPALHGAASSQPIDTGVASVFGWHRFHRRFGHFVGLANVASQTVTVDLSALPLGRGAVDRMSPDDVDIATLAPYQVRWLTGVSDLDALPSPPPRSS